jgi:uncharacterized glyoxalase superfamily protein PhnB
MEKISSLETTVNFYQTTLQYIPEDITHFIHRCEKLKSITILVHAAVTYFQALFMICEICSQRKQVYKSKIPSTLRFSCKVEALLFVKKFCGFLQSVE